MAKSACTSLFIVLGLVTVVNGADPTLDQLAPTGVQQHLSWGKKELISMQVMSISGNELRAGASVDNGKSYCISNKESPYFLKCFDTQGEKTDLSPSQTLPPSFQMRCAIDLVDRDSAGTALSTIEVLPVLKASQVVVIAYDTSARSYTYAMQYNSTTCALIKQHKWRGYPGSSRSPGGAIVQESNALFVNVGVGTSGSSYDAIQYVNLAYDVSPGVSSSRTLGGALTPYSCMKPEIEYDNVTKHTWLYSGRYGSTTAYVYNLTDCLAPGADCTDASTVDLTQRSFTRFYSQFSCPIRIANNMLLVTRVTSSPGYTVLGVYDLGSPTISSIALGTSSAMTKTQFVELVYSEHLGFGVNSTEPAVAVFRPGGAYPGYFFKLRDLSYMSTINTPNSYGTFNMLNYNTAQYTSRFMSGPGAFYRGSPNQNDAFHRRFWVITTGSFSVGGMYYLDLTTGPSPGYKQVQFRKPDNTVDNLLFMGSTWATQGFFWTIDNMLSSSETSIGTKFVFAAQYKNYDSYSFRGYDTFVLDVDSLGDWSNAKLTHHIKTPNPKRLMLDFATDSTGANVVGILQSGGSSTSQFDEAVGFSAFSATSRMSLTPVITSGASLPSVFATSGQKGLNSANQGVGSYSIGGKQYAIILDKDNSVYCVDQLGTGEGAPVWFGKLSTSYGLWSFWLSNWAETSGYVMLPINKMMTYALVKVTANTISTGYQSMQIIRPSSTPTCGGFTSTYGKEAPPVAANGYFYALNVKCLARVTASSGALAFYSLSKCGGGTITLASMSPDVDPEGNLIYTDYEGTLYVNRAPHSGLGSPKCQSHSAAGSSYDRSRFTFYKKSTDVMIVFFFQNSELLAYSYDPRSTAVTDPQEYGNWGGYSNTYVGPGSFSYLTPGPVLDLGSSSGATLYFGMYLYSSYVIGYLNLVGTGQPSLVARANWNLWGRTNPLAVISRPGACTNLLIYRSYTLDLFTDKGTLVNRSYSTTGACGTYYSATSYPDIYASSHHHLGLFFTTCDNIVQVFDMIQFDLFATLGGINDSGGQYNAILKFVDFPQGTSVFVGGAKSFYGMSFASPYTQADLDAIPASCTTAPAKTIPTAPTPNPTPAPPSPAPPPTPEPPLQTIPGSKMSGNVGFPAVPASLLPSYAGLIGRAISTSNPTVRDHIYIGSGSSRFIVVLSCASYTCSIHMPTCGDGQTSTPYTVSTGSSDIPEHVRSYSNRVFVISKYYIKAYTYSTSSCKFSYYRSKRHGQTYYGYQPPLVDGSKLYLFIPSSTRMKLVTYSMTTYATSTTKQLYDGISWVTGMRCEDTVAAYGSVYKYWVCWSPGSTTSSSYRVQFVIWDLKSTSSSAGVITGENRDNRLIFARYQSIVGIPRTKSISSTKVTMPLLLYDYYAKSLNFTDINIHAIYKKSSPWSTQQQVYTKSLISEVNLDPEEILEYKSVSGRQDAGVFQNFPDSDSTKQDIIVLTNNNMFHYRYSSGVSFAIYQTWALNVITKSSWNSRATYQPTYKQAKKDTSHDYLCILDSAGSLRRYDVTNALMKWNTASVFYSHGSSNLPDLDNTHLQDSGSHYIYLELGSLAYTVTGSVRKSSEDYSTTAWMVKKSNGAVEGRFPIKWSSAYASSRGILTDPQGTAAPWVLSGPVYSSGLYSIFGWSLTVDTAIAPLKTTTVVLPQPIATRPFYSGNDTQDFDFVQTQDYAFGINTYDGKATFDEYLWESKTLAQTPPDAPFRVNNYFVAITSPSGSSSSLYPTIHFSDINAPSVWYTKSFKSGVCSTSNAAALVYNGHSIDYMTDTILWGGYGNCVLNFNLKSKTFFSGSTKQKFSLPAVGGPTFDNLRTPIWHFLTYKDTKSTSSTYSSSRTADVHLMSFEGGSRRTPTTTVQNNPSTFLGCPMVCGNYIFVGTGSYIQTYHQQGYTLVKTGDKISLAPSTSIYSPSYSYSGSGSHDYGFTGYYTKEQLIAATPIILPSGLMIVVDPFFYLRILESASETNLKYSPVNENTNLVNFVRTTTTSVSQYTKYLQPAKPVVYRVVEGSSKGYLYVVLVTTGGISCIQVRPGKFGSSSSPPRVTLQWRYGNNKRSVTYTPGDFDGCDITVPPVMWQGIVYATCNQTMIAFDIHGGEQLAFGPLTSDGSRIDLAQVNSSSGNIAIISHQGNVISRNNLGNLSGSSKNQLRKMRGYQIIENGCTAAMEKASFSGGGSSTSGGSSASDSDSGGISTSTWVWIVIGCVCVGGTVVFSKMRSSQRRSRTAMEELKNKDNLGQIAANMQQEEMMAQMSSGAGTSVYSGSTDNGTNAALLCDTGAGFDDWSLNSSPKKPDHRRNLLHSHKNNPPPTQSLGYQPGWGMDPW